MSLQIDPRYAQMLQRIAEALQKAGGQLDLDTLAENLGMDRDELEDMLKPLEEAGLVKIEDDTVALNVEKLVEMLETGIREGIVPPHEAEKVAKEIEEMAKRCRESEHCAEELAEKAEEAAKRLREKIKEHIEKVKEQMMQHKEKREHRHKHHEKRREKE